VNDVAMAIAAAVEQQVAATREIARSIEHVATNSSNARQSMERVQHAVGGISTNAGGVKHVAAKLSSDADTAEHRGEGLPELAAGSRRGYPAAYPGRRPEGDGGRRRQAQHGRVRQLSPGMALFTGSLPAMAAGQAVELRLEALEEPLRGRFIETTEAGNRLQLLLNHQHLAFMERAMARLAPAVAA